MEEQVRTCVKGIVLCKKKLKKEELLDYDNMKIFLQISAIKVAPGAIKQTIRIPLPESYLENADVCMFVKDLQRGIRLDHEKSQRYWRGVLDRAGVTRVTQVMPLRQLKAEYSMYEARRKLCDAYDMFLTDVRVGRLLPALLGKHFTAKKKRPVNINMEKADLVAEIDAALGSTYLHIYNTGDSCSVQVGRCGQSEQQLIANVMAAVDALGEKYPGGMRNIRSMFLKLGKSPALLLYANDVSSEHVPVPSPRQLPGSRRSPVRGELSTVRAASDVIVDRFGGVQLVQKRPLSSDEELTDEEALEEQRAGGRRKHKRTRKPVSVFEDKQRSNKARRQKSQDADAAGEPAASIEEQPQFAENSPAAADEDEDEKPGEKEIDSSDEEEAMLEARERGFMDRMAAERASAATANRKKLKKTGAGKRKQKGEDETKAKGNNVAPLEQGAAEVERTKAVKTKKNEKLKSKKAPVLVESSRLGLPKAVLGAKKREKVGDDRQASLTQSSATNKYSKKKVKSHGKVKMAK